MGRNMGFESQIYERKKSFSSTDNQFNKNKSLFEKNNQDHESYNSTKDDPMFAAIHKTVKHCNNVNINLEKIHINKKKYGKSPANRKNTQNSTNIKSSYLVTEELINMDTINEEAYDPPYNKSINRSNFQSTFGNEKNQATFGSEKNQATFGKLNVKSKTIREKKDEILLQESDLKDIKFEKNNTYGESSHGVSYNPGKKTQERIDKLDKEHLMSADIKAFKDMNAELHQMEQELSRSNSPQKRR